MAKASDFLLHSIHSLNLILLTFDLEHLAVAWDNYTKEELMGKKIVVLTNLKSTKFAGEISEGMLLVLKKKTAANAFCLQ